MIKLLPMSHTEREGFVYSHNFHRYSRDDQSVDRLEQILRFGILSPRKAQELGIPFKRDANIFVQGVKNYDNVIFLFPENSPRQVPIWPDAVTILLSNNMRVVSIEEMTRYQGGNWIILSHLYGEVYRFGRISQKFFREIILPTDASNALNQAREMVNLYLPSMADQISVRSR